MVIVLYSGSGVPDSSLTGGHCDMFLGLTLTVSLYTQLCKWASANLMLGSP